MVERVRIGAGVQPRLEAAFRSVSRGSFVRPELEEFAELNVPLPGPMEDAVLHSPRVATLLLAHLDVEPGNRVGLATPDPYLASLAARCAGPGGEVVVGCGEDAALAERLEAETPPRPGSAPVRYVTGLRLTQGSFDRLLLPQPSGVLPGGARTALRAMGVLVARVPRGGRIELVRLLRAGGETAELFVGELEAPEHPPELEGVEATWTAHRLLAFEDALARVWRGHAVTPEEEAFAEAVAETWRHEPEGNATPEAWALARQLFHVAYVCLLAGDLETAEGLFSASLEVAESAEAYTFLGWAWSFRGAYDEAIEACKRAIRVDPEFGNPYNDVGAYLLELGQPDEAEPWLRRAITATRYGAPAYPYANLARARLMLGDEAGARKALLRAIDLDPTYLAAWQLLDELGDEE